MSSWNGSRTWTSSPPAACLLRPIGLRRGRAGQKLANLERAVGVAILGLVVVAVAFHAVGARADLGGVALAARPHRRHQHVLRLRAGRGLVTLGAAHRSMHAM